MKKYIAFGIMIAHLLPLTGMYNQQPQQQAIPMLLLAQVITQTPTTTKEPIPYDQNRKQRRDNKVENKRQTKQKRTVINQPRK